MTNEKLMPTVYIASFAEAGRGGGIYAGKWDEEAGRFEELQRACEEAPILFVRYSPGRRRLYATRVNVDESDALLALATDDGSPRLTLLNEQVVGGSNPCYIEVTDGLALTANYSGGSVSVLGLSQDGRLEEGRQVLEHKASDSSGDPGNDSHPHSVVVDPSGRWALAADLGLGEVRVYRVDEAQKRLVHHPAGSAQVHSGAGPRHLAFSVDGRFVYLINEYDATLIVSAWDAEQGKLAAVQRIDTLPAGSDMKNAAADLHVHRSGRFLYASNRGHDSIAVMTIEAASGKVELIEHVPTRGSFPRGFALSPSGRWLVVGNQRSDSIATFAVDEQTGRLEARGELTSVPSPIYFAFA